MAGFDRPAPAGWPGGADVMVGFDRPAPAGWPGGADVTDIVRAEVDGAHLKVDATNANFGDPTEGHAKRLRVLALAEELGNISEACRIVGVSRRSFYEWKRIANEQGNDALYPKRAR